MKTDPTQQDQSRPFTSQFTHLNEAFKCEGCGRQVLPRTVSCRNHCPFCLVSKHVDMDPGDRLNPCQGLMDLMGYEIKSKKGLVLIFKCRRCGQTTKNISAHEESIQPDAFDVILSRSATISK